MSFDFSQFILPAAALGATVLTGGAAAPALAGELGATAAGTAAAETAALGAAGTEAAAAGAGTVANTAATDAALTGMAGGTPGAAAPTGWEAIINPMNTQTAGAAGMPGAGTQIPQGAMLNGQILPGGMSVPTPTTTLNGAPAAANMSAAPGSQAFTGGTAAQGAIADAAAVPATKTGLTLQQAQALSKLVNPGGNQAPAPAGSAGHAAAPQRSNLQMANLSAGQIPIGPRASLSQLLYGRH